MNVQHIKKYMLNQILTQPGQRTHQRACRLGTPSESPGIKYIIWFWRKLNTRIFSVASLTVTDWDGFSQIFYSAYTQIHSDATLATTNWNGLSRNFSRQNPCKSFPSVPTSAASHPCVWLRKRSVKIRKNSWEQSEASKKIRVFKNLNQIHEPPPW